MKIGYLGPKGTFSYEMCNNIYKNNEIKIPYKTIRETILALKKEEVDEVVVPIENSQEGCVTETLDTIIQNNDINIKTQKILKIKHNLMSKNIYKLEEIKEVYSHPQALAQCREYLEKNLKNTQIIEVASTAIAASIIKNKEYAACIGNISCKNEYNLKILQENIQDNNLNETKFWILTKNKKDNQENIMTIIFTTKDKPGALYNVLGIFDKYNLNLTKIESRPTKTKLGEYYFWIDIEIKNKDYKKAIEELKQNVGFFRILGKY